MQHSERPRASDPQTISTTTLSTLSASNTTSGELLIDNTNGTNLTIGTVDGLNGVTNTGGEILVDNPNWPSHRGSERVHGGGH